MLSEAAMSQICFHLENHCPVLCVREEVREVSICSSPLAHCDKYAAQRPDLQTSWGLL